MVQAEKIDPLDALPTLETFSGQEESKNSAMFRVGSVSMRLPLGFDSGSAHLLDYSEVLSKIIRSRSPNLLLCGLFTLALREQLRPILDASRACPGTTVLLEICEGKQDVCRIERGVATSMGEQVIAEANQDTQTNMAIFLEKVIKGHRTFKAGAFNVLVLICGEINIVRGNPPKFSSNMNSDFQKIWESIDLVVNPTHDRMGNNGQIQIKRRFLSSLKRLCISVSNRNLGKGQKFSRTMHTLNIDGVEHFNEGPLIQNNWISYKEWVLKGHDLPTNAHALLN